MNLLEVHDIEKAFGGVAAVAGVSFGVPANTIYAVIGPNGAGKTTLFNLLSGVYQPDGGQVSFRGQEIAGLPPHRIAQLGITRTFQNLQLFFNMSVLENVMVGVHRSTVSGPLSACLRLPSIRREEKRIRETAEAALEFCGLAHIAERPADSLPYGALKRIEIARALAADPTLLLLDEPAAGLNETETAEMLDLMVRIRERCITVLLVEHHMDLVMKASDRVLVLDYGSRLAEGTPAEVQNNPDVVAAYLGGEVHYATG